MGHGLLEPGRPRQSSAQHSEDVASRGPSGVCTSGPVAVDVSLNVEISAAPGVSDPVICGALQVSEDPFYGLPVHGGRVLRELRHLNHRECDVRSGTQHGVQERADQVPVWDTLHVRLLFSRQRGSRGRQTEGSGRCLGRVTVDHIVFLKERFYVDFLGQSENAPRQVVVDAETQEPDGMALRRHIINRHQLRGDLIGKLLLGPDDRVVHEEEEARDDSGLIRHRINTRVRGRGNEINRLQSGIDLSVPQSWALS